MYRTIRSHATTATLYSKQLIDEGVITAEDEAALRHENRARLDEEMAAAESYKPNKADWLDGRWSDIGLAEDEARRGVTGVDIEVLKDIGRRITSVPQDFNAHRTIQRLLDRRRERPRAARASIGDWRSCSRSAR